MAALQVTELEHKVSMLLDLVLPATVSCCNFELGI